jgi:hypothetical protein
MARRRRYGLTDKQFEQIEEALPEVDGRGRPYKDHRKVVNGIFWVARESSVASGGRIASVRGTPTRSARPFGC